MSATEVPWDRIEFLLRRDPAGRGLLSHQASDGPLCLGHLERAARHLAEQGRSVAIVTGFCVADIETPTAETDGPPGALFLARALVSLGVEVLLITDSYGLPLLEAGCDLWGWPRESVIEFPFDGPTPDDPRRWHHDAANCRTTDAWIANFLTSGPGARLTHLISIERVGPSHTRASLAAQSRQDPVPAEQFALDVPAEFEDRCHNMRAVNITGYTAKIHRLFEAVNQAGAPGGQKNPVRTLGIGDGGNEIGLGTIPWEVIREAVVFGHGGKTACRIATDDTVLAGVSNWGAYALALTLTALAGDTALAAHWDADDQRRLIEHLVHEAGAVDGATRLQQATVDGLPLETYLQTLIALRTALGLE